MTLLKPKMARIITDHEGVREGLRKSFDCCATVMIVDTEFVCVEQNFVRNEFHMRELIRVSAVPLSAGVELAHWTGEGLPPVGTECELWIRADEWAKCQVIAMDEQDGHPVSVVRYGGGYYAGTNKCLRPIRTPEQIAAEEREAKAKSMWQAIYFNTDPDYWERAPKGTRDTFRAAIDAGWQQVNP